MSAGADTKANTQESVRGRGALELGDLRLLEDGGELRGAFGSDVVLLETVNERRGEDGETEGVSRGADTKANAFGAAGALQRGHGAPLEPLAQLGDALRGVRAATHEVEAAELVVRQAIMGGGE